MTKDLDTQQARLTKAVDTQIEKEEKKAADVLKKKQEEFEAFQVTYNKLRGEYETLAGKDDDGTATDADRVKMAELVKTYEADKEKFDAMEEERQRTMRESEEKAFNKQNKLL
jgi:hypothetical protein